MIERFRQCGCVEVRFGGKRCVLMPQRATFLPGSRMLVLADLHIGKDATFRASGIPVPSGTLGDDLARLDEALTISRASRLVVLGDLFHSRSGRNLENLDVFGRWRQRWCDVEIVLVPGNHDRHAGGPPGSWRIRSEEEPWLADGVAFCHHPECPLERPFFCGHLHPGVGLREKRGGRLRLPCFVVGEGRLILPAFSGFTGLYDTRGLGLGRCFPVVPGRVVSPLPDAAAE